LFPKQRLARGTPVAFDKFSSLIDKKEMGDESRYFKALDEQKKVELRAQLEKLMDQKDHAATLEVVELLSAKPKEVGFLEKYGLLDPKFAVPIALLLSFPLLHFEIYEIDAEAYYFGFFMIYVGIIAGQTGPDLVKHFDGRSAEISKQIKQVDDSILEASLQDIEENKKFLTIDKDFRALYQVIDDLTVTQADVLNFTAEHKYRDAIAKKLDALVALEESTTNALRSRMVQSVTNDVIQQFTSDKKIKETALEQAISVLSAGPAAKQGKDVVGSVFGASLKAYREAYAKKPAGSDEILVNLEKELVKSSEPPAAEGGGGNVYTISPVLRV